MTRLFPPIYVIKVLDLDNNVIADPLPVSNVTFTQRLAMPGRQDLGTWQANLIPARGAQRHYISTYRLLDYRQRVEIYPNNTSRFPAFTGRIIDLPTDLSSGMTISGDEWLGRLSERALRHLEFIGGEANRTFDQFGTPTALNNIRDQLRYLFNLWQMAYKTDFNEGIGPEWTQSNGTWTTSIIDGRQVLEATTDGFNSIDKDLALDSDSELNFRVQVDMRAGPENESWTRRLVVFRDSTSSRIAIQIQNRINEGRYEVNICLLRDGALLFERNAGRWQVPPEEWFTLDLWTYVHEDTTRYYELSLNRVQFLVFPVDDLPIGGSLRLVTEDIPAYFDNFIVWHLQAEMFPQIDLTTIPDETEWNNDKYLQAVSALCDMVDWEWRTNSNARPSIDSILIGDSVGQDQSDRVRFVEKQNLISLQLHPSSTDQVTWVRFNGQGQGPFQRLAASFDFPATDRYGIIEADITDNRITGNQLARRKAENALVRLKDGQASLTAQVLESVSTDGSWRIGDMVWCQSTEPDINRLVKVVEITRRSNDRTVDVVFDNFPYSRSGREGFLSDDIGKVNRGTKGNAGKITIPHKYTSWWLDDDSADLTYVQNATVSNEQWFKLDASLGIPLFQGVPLALLQEIARDCYAFTLRLTSHLDNFVAFSFFVLRRL